MKLKLCLLCLIALPFALSIQNWMLIAPLLIKQEVNWSVAQNYCRENYLDLYTLTNQSDQVKLIDEVNKNNVAGLVWIGLYNDLDSWYWSYNHLPLKNTSLRKWQTGYPNNAYGENVCGTITVDGYWKLYSYNDRARFICYDANYTGANRFLAYPSLSKKWLAAQAFCRTYHTDLASAINETDITIMQQIISGMGYTLAWFGLVRDTWKWLDGTDASYIPWLSGQPDNFYTWENCGAAQNGLLNDEQCSNQYYFVCSAYLYRKQIVKLQVKSDQNVFDPAVQASILDLINQKLQEHGMLVNTTATWRVQPDGNIFYKKAKDNVLP